MAKVAQSTRLLHILKKKPNKISYYSSPQVPKGKYYFFRHSKGWDVDDAARIFKQAKPLMESPEVEYEHWGDRHCAFFLMTLVGLGTTLKFSIQGLVWFVDRYFMTSDNHEEN